MKKSTPSTERNDLLAGALVLAAHGLRVHPNRPGEKSPVDTGWLEKSTADPKIIEQEWRRRPNANIGVATGGGVFVLDVDDLISKENMEEEHGQLPPTWEATTPGKNGDGRHLYFRAPPGIVVRNSAGKLGKGLDVRGDGGQVVAPPSVHPNGGRYAWAAGRAPGDLPLAEAPAWLLDLLREPVNLSTVAADGSTDVGLRALARGLEVLSLAIEGQRNDTLNKVALVLGQFVARGDLLRPDAEIALRAKALAIGLDAGEIDSTIRSGLEKGISKPRTFHATDYGNAKRLVYRHGADLCFCYSNKKWYAWDDVRWAEDNPGEVERRAKETVISIYSEAKTTSDESRRKALGQWAVKSESGLRLREVVRVAESEPTIPVGASKFDADPMLLNCLNGTLDLRTGELRPHNRADLITKLAPVQYDPAARCPQFDEFLLLIMNGRPALVEFLWLAFAWALTGDVGDEVVFLFSGQGENGKSQLIKLIEMLLGDYAVKAGFDTFLKKNRSSIRNDIARLRGARFVSAMEAEEGDQLAMALVKEITGGDKIVSRFLYKEFVEWRPQFKLFFGVNHLPQIRGQEHATWRRIRVVPFDIKIKDKVKVIDNFAETVLRPELPGVLAKMVRACLAWQKAGRRIAIPEEVAAATADYRSDMDIIGDFIRDECVEREGLLIAAQKIYTAYKSWCDRNGHQPLSQRRFGAQLRARPGLTKSKRGIIRWEGIGLRSDRSNRLEM